MMPRLLKKSFSLKGHRTSVALEPEFWAWLDLMSQDQPLTVTITHCDLAREDNQSLASALRLKVLAYLQANLPADFETPLMQSPG